MNKHEMLSDETLINVLIKPVTINSLHFIKQITSNFSNYPN